MQLEEFFDYKSRLMDDLLGSEEIVRLLSDDYKTVDQPESLIYKQVFPWEYVPEIVEHGKTFICSEVEIQKVYNKTYWSPTIYVWVFTYKTMMRLPGGGLRVDKICAEIAKKLNGSRYYGLGELELSSVRRFSPITDYEGKVMVFTAQDFNRQSPTGKPVPSNRRTGQ